MRKIIAFVICIVMTTSVASATITQESEVSFYVSADEIVRMRIDGKYASFNDELGHPFDMRSVGMGWYFPLRAVSKMFGVEAEWFEDDRTAQVDFEESEEIFAVSLQSTLAAYGNRESEEIRYEKINPTPILINDRTYIPLKYLIEKYFKYDMEWNEEAKIVLVDTTTAPKVDEEADANAETDEEMEQTVEVPDVRGMEVTDTIRLLQDSGLRMPNLNYEPSNTVPANHVIWQSVDPGEVISKISLHSLSISTGPAKMPDLTGKSLEEAKAELSKLKIDFGIIVIEENSDTFENGKIISQLPNPSDDVDASTTITLTVCRLSF